MVTKVKEVESVYVMEDGQIHVVEITHYKERGKIMSSRRDSRVIDVGEPLVGESDLIKDVVNGNLHSATRKAARQAIKDAENP